MDSTASDMKHLTNKPKRCYSQIKMDLCDLRAYVTPTEWDWMHGNLLTSSVLEIDLERPEVYACVIGHCAHTLVAHGSLATLQTESGSEQIKIYLKKHGFPYAMIVMCMERPLCVVQYVMEILMYFCVQHVVVSWAWRRAIYAGRRDVLSWMRVDFPNIVQVGLDLTSVYEGALCHKQGRTARWVCKLYGIPVRRVLNKRACFLAAQTNQIKELQWLRRGPFKCAWNQPKCLAEAEKCGYIKIATWIRRQRE